MSMNWLSLKQAAERLGIHPTTMRRWADNGDVPVYVTPGGHRRFLESDIEAIIQSRFQPQSDSAEEMWASRALLNTQRRLRDPESEIKWLAEFDEEQRAIQRDLGQRLLGLIMHHISLPEDDDSLMEEARSIAQNYASNCTGLGLTAARCLEIIIFFRDSLTETALKLPQVANFDESMLVRLIRKINQVFNLLQVELVEYYDRQ